MQKFYRKKKKEKKKKKKISFDVFFWSLTRVYGKLNATKSLLNYCNALQVEPAHFNTLQESPRPSIVSRSQTLTRKAGESLVTLAY